MCRCTHNDICRLSGCRVRRKDIFIVMITLCGDQQLNPNIQSGGEYKWPGVAAGCAVPLSRGRHGYLLHQQSYHDTIYTASYSPILNSHKVNIKDFWFLCKFLSLIKFYTIFYSFIFQCTKDLINDWTLKKISRHQHPTAMPADKCPDRVQCKLWI